MYCGVVFLVRQGPLGFLAIEKLPSGPGFAFGSFVFKTTRCVFAFAFVSPLDRARKTLLHRFLACVKKGAEPGRLP